MKDDEIIIIKQGNKTTATTWAKAMYPYFLLEALKEACEHVIDTDEKRKIMRAVAWYMGTKGFTEECRVIAEAVKDPEPKPTLGMYGWFSI